VGIGLARLVADAAAQADTSEDVNTLAVGGPRPWE
jgi:hypothetical protein